MKMLPYFSNYLSFPVVHLFYWFYKLMLYMLTGKEMTSNKNNLPIIDIGDELGGL